MSVDKVLKKHYFNEIKNCNRNEFYERYFFIISKYLFSLIKKLNNNADFENDYYFFADEIHFVLDNINNRRAKAKFKKNDFYNFMQIYYSEYVEDSQLHFVIKNVINKIINHECYRSIDISNIMDMHMQMHKSLSK